MVAGGIVFCQYSIVFRIANSSMIRDGARILSIKKVKNNPNFEYGEVIVFRQFLPFWQLYLTKILRYSTVCSPIYRVVLNLTSYTIGVFL